MTVVIGVVTVGVVSVGVVTLTVVIGVSIVTVTGDVGIGNAGGETVGPGSVEGSNDGADSAVDERTGSGVAPSLGPFVDSGTALTCEPPLGLE